MDPAPRGMRMKIMNVYYENVVRLWIHGNSIILAIPEMHE